jgi:uncharacterized membrane protein YtjA (UPF0391 family)
VYGRWYKDLIGNAGTTCIWQPKEGLIILCLIKLKLMLRWSVIFFVIAIIAAIFGFGGIAEGAASIAKILFFIFLALFVITILFGASLFKK